MNYNPVGWFEIYVQDMDRATEFYETVLDIKLEKLELPAPNVRMLSFPMEAEAKGASGALVSVEGVTAGDNRPAVILIPGFANNSNCFNISNRYSLAKDIADLAWSLLN